MKKRVRPKHSEKSNIAIQFLAKKTADQILGIDKIVPPHIRNEVPKETVRVNVPVQLVKSPLLSDYVWDGFCALSLFVGCITTGIFIGMSMR